MNDTAGATPASPSSSLCAGGADASATVGVEAVGVEAIGASATPLTPSLARPPPPSSSPPPLDTFDGGGNGAAAGEAAGVLGLPTGVAGIRDVVDGDFFILANKSSRCALALAAASAAGVSDSSCPPDASVAAATARWWLNIAVTRSPVVGGPLRDLRDGVPPRPCLPVCGDFGLERGVEERARAMPRAVAECPEPLAGRSFQGAVASCAWSGGSSSA